MPGRLIIGDAVVNDDLSDLRVRQQLAGECRAGQWRGIGSALVAALVADLAARGVRELRLTMTNDNLDALRFYQRRGFRLAALRPGAVDDARRLKPAIPVVGNYGIARHDELELVLILD